MPEGERGLPVWNTTPVTHLHRIGYLHLWHAAPGPMVVPRAVARELAGPQVPVPWDPSVFPRLAVVDVAVPDHLARGLDTGDSAAIPLACAPLPPSWSWARRTAGPGLSHLGCRSRAPWQWWAERFSLAWPRPRVSSRMGQPQPVLVRRRPWLTPPSSPVHNSHSPTPNAGAWARPGGTPCPSRLREAEGRSPSGPPPSNTSHGPRVRRDEPMVTWAPAT
jgi:hypothetical protein